MGVHEKVKGAAVTVPKVTPLARNSTLAIDPDVPVTAVIVVAELIWMGVADETVIVGAASELTEIVAVSLVAGTPVLTVVYWLPPLSVATAVRR